MHLRFESVIKMVEDQNMCAFLSPLFIFFFFFIGPQLKNTHGNKLKVKVMYQHVERLGKMMTQNGLSFKREEMAVRRKKFLQLK